MVREKFCRAKSDHDEGVLGMSQSQLKSLDQGFSNLRNERGQI